MTNGDLAFDYHGYARRGRLVDRYSTRARRLFPGWEADVVLVTVTLVNRDEAKAIGMISASPHNSSTTRYLAPAGISIASITASSAVTPTIVVKRADETPRGAHAGRR